MNEEDKRSSRELYRSIVDEIRSIGKFPRQQECFMDEIISLMEDQAIGEAQKRYYQP